MGNLFHGAREAAQDWNTYSYDSTADLTPSGTGNLVLNYGIHAVNYSGTGALVAVLPSGVEQTTNSIYIKDTFGGAGGANIIVSGSYAGQTINGSAKITAISSAYGSVHLFNYSGTTWVTL